MTKSVLIVEDDPKVLKLIKAILEGSGNITLEATDGKQAITIAKDRKPDLILMDIQMPVMNGLDATKILKADEQTKDIPVIALTAHAMQGDEEKIRQAGCDDFMTKPFKTKVLLKKVVDHLSK